MLQVALGSGGDDFVRFRQHSVFPMVYLDHCAWRAISEDDALRSRLATAIRNRNGTLAISWLNLAEYSRVRNLSQAAYAERLIEEVLPNVFFIECNPITVERRERELRRGTKLLPHADNEFMESFVSRGPSGLRLISASGFFRLLQDSRVPDLFKALADDVAGFIQEVADGFKSNNAIQVRFKTGRGKPTARLVFDELIRTYLVDGKSKFDSHDAIDLMHATVPNAFCDFVVLDGEWRHRSEQIRPRLRDATGSDPPSRVYSVKREDLERFLADVETVER